MAKGCEKVSPARRVSANQFSGHFSCVVTKPREAMTVWCNDSRIGVPYPCYLHHLKSYQGCGQVGNTTKNQGQSNLRGQSELTVNDFFWLLPVAFCNTDLQQLPNPPSFLRKNMPTLNS